MHFRVDSSDGRTLKVEAADWTMAMVRASEILGVRVAGFTCDTRPDGSVHVADDGSAGLSWEITPLPGDRGAVAPAPARAPTPMQAPPRSTPMMHARRRPYRAPQRKPLWSPDGGSAPTVESSLEGEPLNLAERVRELAGQIRQSSNAQEAIERTLYLAMSLVNCEAGSVLRGGLDDEALVFVAVRGGAGDALLGRELPYGEGIAGASCEAGITLQVLDVPSDPRHKAEIDAETGFVTRALLCVPIRTDVEFFGVVELLNPRRQGGFSAWQVPVVESLALALAQTLGGYASNALEE